MHIRRGSVLLETMIAIFILSICIIVSLNSIIQQIKCSNREDENNRDNYSIKAVCSEIKYNVTYDTILAILISGNKSIKYSNDFTLKIINTDLTAFESPESEDWTGDNKGEMDGWNLRKKEDLLWLKQSCILQYIR